MSDGKGLNLCPSCAALRLQITLLKAENEYLKAENRRLKAKLAAIRKFAERVKAGTEHVLSQRSGVWRDKWHVAKGADVTVDGVLRRC